jgi:hypothetical protein
MKNPLYTSSEVDEWGKPECPVILVHSIHGKLRMVPIGVTIYHLINSLQCFDVWKARPIIESR